METDRSKIKHIRTLRLFPTSLLQSAQSPFSSSETVALRDEKNEWDISKLNLHRLPINSGHFDCSARTNSLGSNSRLIRRSYLLGGKWSGDHWMSQHVVEDPRVSLRSERRFSSHAINSTPKMAKYKKVEELRTRRTMRIRSLYFRYVV